MQYTKQQLKEIEQSCHNYSSYTILNKERLSNLIKAVKEVEK